MSLLTKKLLYVRIPDFSITVFVFLVGCIFSVYIFFSVKSIVEFIEGFKNPLVFALYYLWFKAIIVDIQRIAQNKEHAHTFPGFVYWVYASQWFVYWAINDMAFSSAQLSSAYNGNRSWIVSLYFLNSSFLWLLLDIISSFLLFPLKYLLTNDKTINTLLIVDYLKFLVIFIVFGFLSIF